MSLINMPFVGTDADLSLHVVASVVMIVTVVGIAYGFWKLHEIPIQKAHQSEHRHLGLITILTWIGFFWHWVWVLAIIVAFFDLEEAIIHLRDIWHEQPRDKQQQDKGDELC